MRRPISLALVTCLATALSSFDFINPPPESGFGDNPVYMEGSTVNVAWQPITSGKRFSLTLWQANTNGSGYVQDFEFINRDVINITSQPWFVGTARDLAFSNIFIMCIYEEGSEVGKNSHRFNLTAWDKSPITSAASSGAGATAASTATEIKSSPTPSTAAPSRSSSPASPGPSHNGAVIGLGVVIPVALILGVGIGWFLRRWRSNEKGGTARGTFPDVNHRELPRPVSIRSPLEIGIDQRVHELADHATPRETGLDPKSRRDWHRLARS
ncbi:hypothetical protein F4778DRAFT_790306 [Xylariomycetidae sp. FL2044]|nr:hypothetical protein F4778DRAFT_790306 [Xylariomycetidae sp. FL2044]